MPTTVETLTLIWRRVLQRSPISPEDSFFDIGGTDALADLLCSEIGQVYGRPLPSATLRQAPTIAALAAILEKPTPRRPSPFVDSKACSKEPPIFIAHGLCGTVQFTELAKHIRTGHPIYGIQGKGLDEIEEPLERVEDMARFYLEALEELYPQVPRDRTWPYPRRAPTAPLSRLIPFPEFRKLGGPFECALQAQ